MSKPNPGVYAAVSTPLSADLRPDPGRLISHCQWLLENGCDGLAPLGTTGESNSLALSDRIAVIGYLAGAGLPMEKMIIGTGACALHETIELSHVALDAGVNGLLVLPPFYYKNPTEDGLYGYFSRLAEQLADKAPRIFLYHFPALSSVAITVGLVGRLRAAFPGIFVGMKDSSGDFENTRKFLQEFERFEAFSGTETAILDNLKAGGSGCISATTNITAPLVARAVKSGDATQAGRLLAQAAAMRDLIAALGMVSGTKAAISAYRGDPEWLRCLPPNVAVSAEATGALHAALEVIWAQGARR